MAHKSQAYLIVDADAEGLRPEQLSRALRRHRVACVLLASRQGGVERLRALAAACQLEDAAALIEADPQLALAAGADGVHLPYPGSAEAAERLYKVARQALGAKRIVGAASGLLRHDAMVLAELGADYLAFEDEAGADPARLLEHVGWWAEMFEVPCVAWGAASRDDVRRLAAAGADFVAAGPVGGIDGALDNLAALTEPQEAGA